MISSCLRVDRLYNVAEPQMLRFFSWCALLQCESFLVSPFLHISVFSRRLKDSKDEVAKAEKELEGIHKVMEESGGKLSNRLLQCDVRLPC